MRNLTGKKILKNSELILRLFILPGPGLAGRHIIELLISILIISLLVMIAAPIYVDCQKRAEIIHVAGETGEKQSILLYHAINGDWPRGQKDLEKFDSLHDLNLRNETPASDYIKAAEIENGALHYIFKGDSGEKILTLRPGVPENCPDGPVIFVSGKKRSGWKLAGSDRTDIDKRLINRFFR